MSQLPKQAFERLLVSVLLSIAAFASTTSFAATCPTSPFPGSNDYCIDGLVAGSYPYFETSVAFKFKPGGNKGTTLSASYNNAQNAGISLFNLSSEIVPLTISNTRFNFSATILDSQLTGSMSISGNIDALGIHGKPDLMTANLTGVYGQDGNLIGFNTKDIICNDAINSYIGGSGCTTSEVVYFALNGTIDFSGKNQKLYGIAYTSVPLPSAIWLFGSGLLGLIGISRRKNAA